MNIKSVKLRDIAKVIRSKNAGPFEITFDIIFRTKEDYEKVKASGVLNKRLIASLYNLDPQNILTFVFYDAANAVKITIPRMRPQGSIGEVDMHGAQQYVPLFDIDIPIDL
ncbi:DUF4387 domain-containing protein [Acetomicrobium sp.]|uniref:DUF4387 domain-containing protein n=1 Tax=Acetomicrobium sp. TaxID=1872099 RepID=UPI002871F0DC|nr:DUF4387 domain-containing protein [Acetomicrobium sp.]MDR9769099.1 DUF4387 domain-containing protein [Acetomicrobium sp.]